MFLAHIGQLREENYAGEPYKNYVLFVRLDSDTKTERIIRGKHERISTLLQKHNVCYVEITTDDGKDQLYKKFNLQNKDFPLFMIFSKFPKYYKKGDYIMLIEWGKWKNENYDILKDDVVKFACFFSDEKLKQKLANAGNKKTWNKVLKYIKVYGPAFTKICATVIRAIL